MGGNMLKESVRMNLVQFCNDYSNCNENKNGPNGERLACKY